MDKIAVLKDPGELEYVSHQFITPEMLQDFDNDDYELAEWFNAHKQSNTEKGKIKDELIPTAWHPTIMPDCCMTEDEKKKDQRNVYLGKVSIRQFVQLSDLSTQKNHIMGSKVYI